MKKGITLKGKEIAGRGGNRGRAGPRSTAKKEMEKRKGIKRGGRCEERCNGGEKVKEEERVY